MMNKNDIVTDTWSNASSQALYECRWSTEPELVRQHENGQQCGGCSFFATFNKDWGLCCHTKSRYHLETVFEHFTCPTYVDECWGPHSFTEDKDFHCRCNGEPSEYWDNLVKTLNATEREQSEG